MGIISIFAYRITNLDDEATAAPCYYQGSLVLAAAAAVTSQVQCQQLVE
jgi:hypothetical protein